MAVKRQKLGALIPIRLSSERLPGKALKEINGRPVLHHLLDRAFSSRFLIPENVIICTTWNAEDDQILEAIRTTGAGVFRGSENDIIDRFWRATEQFGFDSLIQIDGDDPCIDPGYMDMCMEALLEDEELGIVYCEGLPLGLGSKAIRSSALKRVWEAHVTEDNDTGFIYYLTKTSLCKQKKIGPLNPSHINTKARMTLDYEEDLEFLRKVFGLLGSSGEIFSIDDITDLLQKQPELMDINSFLSEQYWKRTNEKVFLEYRSADGDIVRI